MEARLDRSRTTPRDPSGNLCRGSLGGKRIYVNHKLATVGQTIFAPFFLPAWTSIIEPIKMWRHESDSKIVETRSDALPSSTRAPSLALWSCERRRINEWQVASADEFDRSAGTFRALNGVVIRRLVRGREFTCPLTRRPPSNPPITNPWPVLLKYSVSTILGPWWRCLNTGYRSPIRRLLEWWFLVFLGIREVLGMHYGK